MNPNNPRMILDWYQAHLIGDCICDRVEAGYCSGDMGPEDESNEECPCECHYQAEEEEMDRWIGAMFLRSVAQRRIAHKKTCRKSTAKNGVSLSEPDAVEPNVQSGPDVA